MPTDDPTDPTTDSPPRRRVSGAALLDAIDQLPDRIAARVGGTPGGSATHPSPEDADSPLPPEVTFEAEPEPEPKSEDLPEPPPVDDIGDTPARRRSGFPRRKR